LWWFRFYRQAIQPAVPCVTPAARIPSLVSAVLDRKRQAALSASLKPAIDTQANCAFPETNSGLNMIKFRYLAEKSFDAPENRLTNFQ
jgi:hypothetical protein